MIKVGRKLWKNASDEEKISYCDGLFEDSKGAVQKRHFEWYMNYQFLEGNHYVSYNSVTNSLETPPRKTGEVRIVVNKVKSGVRAIKNYATRTEPKWETMPGDLDEKTILNARRSGKLLDYIYRKLHLETLVSGVVDSSLNTSVAWVELDWDDKAEGGMGQIRLRLHDSFGVWTDPKAFLYAGRYKGRYLFKTNKKSLDKIKSDERYDKKARKLVKSDDELAASAMKSRIIRKESGSLSSEKTKRAIVKEAMLWEDEENENGGNLRLFTYAGGQVLRDESLKDKNYSMYLMQIPMDPRKIYHRSWVADSVPLNKALDRSVSQKIMYVNQALIYRIMAEKGHGVKEVNNDMGTVYEINKGRKYEQMSMHALPGTLDSLSGELGSYIEDALGSHDAALGKLPAGARSGKTLEALQAADSNNLADIVQGLVSFLAVLGEGILDIVADKYVASRVIKLTEPEEGGAQYAKVIGEGSDKKNRPDDATIITKDNEVIVRIGSWLGYTREAQRETLLKLGEIGILPGDEILRQFEFPNVDELSEKARSQRMEQHELDAEVAGRNQQSQQDQKPTGGADMVQLADKENTSMANGQIIEPTEGATPQHTQVHADFIETEIFQGLPPEIQQTIMAHYQGEAETQGLV